ncbi:zeta toxin family protein [Kitasatospora sp. NPDC054768]|uniref:zeta toxin family protein n=1 Tax=Kitasatospora sp. NBC_01519 TaxID=2903576 RepID=UPI002F90C825
MSPQIPGSSLFDDWALAPDQARKRFEDWVVPVKLAGPRRQEEPLVFVVEGGPGAGKTYTQNRIQAQLEAAGRGAGLGLDVDAFHSSHPRFEEIRAAHGVSFSRYTGVDASRFFAMAVEYGMSNRFDILREGELRPDTVRDVLAPFDASGVYRSEAAFIAVAQATSGIAALYRCQQERRELGVGRAVPPDSRARILARVPQSLAVIEDHALSDTVNVYDRSGHLLHHSTAVRTGEENGRITRARQQPAGAVLAYQHEATRPWSAQESGRFTGIAAELAHDSEHPLEPVLLYDLAHTVLQAAPHIDDRPAAVPVAAVLAHPPAPFPGTDDVYLRHLSLTIQHAIDELAAGKAGNWTTSLAGAIARITPPPAGAEQQPARPAPGTRPQARGQHPQAGPRCGTGPVV